MTEKKSWKNKYIFFAFFKVLDLNLIIFKKETFFIFLVRFFLYNLITSCASLPILWYSQNGGYQVLTFLFIMYYSGLQKIKSLLHQTPERFSFYKSKWSWILFLKGYTSVYFFVILRCWSNPSQLCSHCTSMMLVRCLELLSSHSSWK